MSITVTLLDPRTADGTACSRPLMPSFLAMSTAFCGPTCKTSCAYSVLKECTVPSKRLVPPGAPSPGSALHTCHGPDGGSKSEQPGAGKISESGMPCVSAAASTNGLNAEPVPRPFSAGSSLQPMARLHFAAG